MTMWLDHRRLESYEFAVINPLEVDATQWCDLRALPLVPRGLQAKQAQLPLLIELNALGDQVRLDLLARAAQWERQTGAPLLSLMMRSASSVDRVRSHLSAQLLVRDNARQRVLLRWYDPNVFTHMAWLMEPHQIASLSGPVTQWAWQAPNGQWQQLERPDCDPDPIRRFQPNAVQWETLGRIGVINRMMRELRSAREVDLLDAPLYRTIDECLAQAYAALESEDESDVRCLARQFLIFGRQIDQQPQIANRISQAREGATTYVGLCSNLDESTLAVRAAFRDPLKHERMRNHVV